MKVVKTKDLPWVGVSHNPEIRKKVFIDRGFIPKLMTFGKAVFKPGQTVDAHKHDTMFEIFYILSGKALFVVHGKEIVVSKDECIILEPGDVHSQSNPFESEVEWVYFGIATD